MPTPRFYKNTALEYDRQQTDYHEDGTGGVALDFGLTLGARSLLRLYAGFGEDYGATRAELARMLPASEKSVTRWTQELEEKGWVYVKHRFNKTNLVTLTGKAKKYFGNGVLAPWQEGYDL